MDNRSQRRFGGSRSAEQIDKRIFKARRGVGHLQRRHVAMLLDFLNAGVLFQDQAHRFALDHAIADLRQLQRPLQQTAVVFLWAGDEETAPGHGLRQRRRLTLVEQFAFVHQQHVAALFRFIEIGGAPQDQHAVAGQLVHHLPQLAARDRVDADAGLIQQQYFRVAHQGTGEPQLLLHAAGKLACQPFGERAKGGELQQTVENFLPRLAGDAAQVGVQGQVFHHRQIFIQAEFLRHIAEHRVQGAVVF